MIGQIRHYNGCQEQEGEGRGKEKGQAKRRKQEEGNQMREEGEGENWGTGKRMDWKERQRVSTVCNPSTKIRNILPGDDENNRNQYNAVILALRGKSLSMHILESIRIKKFDERMYWSAHYINQSSERTVRDIC